jgi:hypothetical protein
VNLARRGRRPQAEPPPGSARKAPKRIPAFQQFLDGHGRDIERNCFSSFPDGDLLQLVRLAPIDARRVALQLNGEGVLNEPGLTRGSQTGLSRTA